MQISKSFTYTAEFNIAVSFNTHNYIKNMIEYTLYNMN